MRAGGLVRRLTMRFTWMFLLVLGVGCLANQGISAQEAKVNYFPCGTDHCSIQAREYCPDREKTCKSCQREMQWCGKQGMDNMRPMCLSYCIQDLKEHKTVQKYKSTMQATNKTYEEKLASLRDQTGNIEEEKKVLAVKYHHLCAVAGMLGFLLLISLVVNFLQYLGVGCFRRTPLGKDMVITPMEEESLIENGGGNPDEAKQLATVADEASSGMGSEPNTPFESTEALAPATAVKTAKTREVPVRVAPDSAGERPGEPSRPAPGGLQEKPAGKGRGGRPNNGLGFPDLARDANNGTDVAEDTVDLAQNPDGFQADPSTVPPSSPQMCRVCQRNPANAAEQSCTSCRAQQLSVPSGGAPGPGNGSSGGNSDPSRDFQRVFSSIRDTNPSNSKFAPSGALELRSQVNA